MTNALKHRFTSPYADHADASLVQSSDWNDEHLFAGGSAGQVLGWDSSQSDKVSWVSRAWMTYAARGSDCANNGSTPNTQFDLDADSLVLYAPTLQDTVVRHNPGAALTNNLALAGSAANGRDQAGAFSNDSWVHLYWVWNGSTLATLSSTVAPPTGPTFPSTYTHFAYAGAVRIDGSGNLKRTRIKGAWAYYEGFQQALNDGAATSSTSVSLTGFVPPNALRVMLRMRLVGDSAASRTATLELVSGTTHLTVQTFSTDVSDAFVTVPNLSQALRYYTSNAAAVVDIDILGYVLPTGGE